MEKGEAVWETYETTAPRTLTGDVSDMYRGTRTERAPTPRPAVHLPMAIPTHFPGPTATCATTPIEKIAHQAGIHHFRPYLFANGPAIKHPINVPIESCCC